MSSDEILLEAEEKMIKTEQVVVNEFAGVRTGKASPSLVENIQVEVYGSMMRIRELAAINTPESRQLVIQPWDAASLQPIEKAIQKANLGLSPVVQGRLIRLRKTRKKPRRKSRSSPTNMSARLTRTSPPRKKKS
jgi:ribosome recycling factor